MLNLELNSGESVSNLFKEGIDIFSIKDVPKEKISYLCNRISKEIGTLVDWYCFKDIAYVKVMERYVESAINIGINIIFNDFDTDNIKYLKDKNLISLYSDYEIIAMFNMEDLNIVKQWCESISNTMKVIVDDNQDKCIFSKRPFSDYNKIINAKDTCNIDCSSFKFFDPIQKIVKKFSYSINHYKVFSRVIDCSEDEVNELLKSILKHSKYKLTNINTAEQLETFKIAGSFESIYKVYHNRKRYTNGWIVIGSVKDNGELLSKIMIV